MNESNNPQSESTPELLEVITPGEAAVLFRVSTGTIKKWYDSDQLGWLPAASNNRNRIWTSPNLRSVGDRIRQEEQYTDRHAKADETLTL